MSYELMLVLSAKSDGQSFASGIEKSLKDEGASDLKVSDLGKKTLAYPIKNQQEGNYFVLNFESTGEVIGSLNNKLRLEQEALLRYLIIKSKAAKVSKLPEISKVTAKVTVEAKKVSPVKEQPTTDKKRPASKKKAVKPVKKASKTKTVKGPSSAKASEGTRKK